MSHQDFTGVPCVVDLAAMRDAIKRLGGDPNKINPLVNGVIIFRHSSLIDSSIFSLQVDYIIMSLTISNTHSILQTTELIQVSWECLHHH